MHPKLHEAKAKTTRDKRQHGLLIYKTREMASRGLERRLLRAVADGDAAAVEALVGQGADPGCQVRVVSPDAFISSTCVVPTPSSVGGVSVGGGGGGAVAS